MLFLDATATFCYKVTPGVCRRHSAVNSFFSYYARTNALNRTHRTRAADARVAIIESRETEFQRRLWRPHLFW